MPVIAYYLLAAASGALGWAWFTKPDETAGEAETVYERVTTNLGTAAVFAMGAVACVWFWRKRGQ